MTSPDERPAPILLWPGDSIGLKQAQHLVGRGPKTVKRWCQEHAIGFNSCRGAGWEISAPGLVMVRHRDLVALELLRSGNRNHPSVQRVLDYLASIPEAEHKR